MNISHRSQFDSAYFSAFVLVIFSGLLWSFGVVTVRYMVDGQDYVFQYLFYRGISIAVILIFYLFILFAIVGIVLAFQSYFSLILSKLTRFNTIKTIQSFNPILV